MQTEQIEHHKHIEPIFNMFNLAITSNIENSVVH